MDDADFNADIWLLHADGSGSPVNISKHPDNESNPVWSPDGRAIAFTGRRFDTEVDIYYVWLRAEDDARSRRERTIEKAIEKINKARKKESPAAAASRDTTNTVAQAGAEPVKPAPEAKGARSGPKPDAARKVKQLPEVVIDFERLHERVRQISIPNSSETGLMWSPDSKKLAFTATVDGKRGTYTVEFPDELRPKLLSAETGTQGRWLETGNQIVWRASSAPPPSAAATPDEPRQDAPGGVPASLTDAGKLTRYTFRVFQESDSPSKFRAAFDLAWRTMRDQWYDERLGNRNWTKFGGSISMSPSALPTPVRWQR